MLLFYRIPSAPSHAATHGIVTHLVGPQSEPSKRGTAAAPLEQTVILTAGVLNGYANANGTLIALYGWDPSLWKLATAAAARQVSAVLQIARS